MKASEQGVASAKKQRYSVIPRTLVFLFRQGEAGREILMIKGAPTKRLWANKYNGIGGHVEAGEDVLAAAHRELAEESGIDGVALRSRGAINILVSQDEANPTGVMVFLFSGELGGEHSLITGDEGALAWLPVEQLSEHPLVDDLYELIPRLLAQDGPVYGHYAPDSDGTMVYRFR